MKRLIVALFAGMTCLGAAAWHGPCGPCGPHHWHGGWGWGRGGCNFWPGFVGGVIGGAVASSCWARPYYSTPVVVAQPSPVVVTQPVVVQQPTVIQQPVVQQVVQQPVVVQQQAAPVVQQRQVWVEGCYINHTGPDGAVTRVWNPGHYEMR